jgi:hypothetical protein
VSAGSPLPIGLRVGSAAPRSVRVASGSDRRPAMRSARLSPAEPAKSVEHSVRPARDALSQSDVSLVVFLEGGPLRDVARRRAQLALRKISSLRNTLTIGHDHLMMVGFDKGQRHGTDRKKRGRPRVLEGIW